MYIAILEPTVSVFIHENKNHTKTRTTVLGWAMSRLELGWVRSARLSCWAQSWRSRAARIGFASNAGRKSARAEAENVVDARRCDGLRGERRSYN